MLGDNMFRTDDDVDRDGIVREDARVREVLRRPYPGNFLGGVEKRVGDLAGRHVDLILIRNRENQVGIINTRTFEHTRVRSRTRHRPDIESILQSGEFFRINIDQRDIIVFTREDLAHRCADLSGSENDDFHVRWSLRPGSSLPVLFVLGVEPKTLQFAVQMGALQFRAFREFTDIAPGLEQVEFQIIPFEVFPCGS